MTETKHPAGAIENRYAAMERDAFGPEPPCGCDACRTDSGPVA